jgi:glycerate kinase
MPGAGAAGGLGYGLAVFCGAELRLGFSMIAEALRLEERISACDMVVTGEGRMDRQTLSGKAPAEVARLARKHGEPIALICGECDGDSGAEELFQLIIALRDIEPNPGLAMRNAANLVQTVSKSLVEWAISITGSQRNIAS